MRTKSLLGVVAVLLIGAATTVFFRHTPKPPTRLASAVEEIESEQSQEPRDVEATPRPEVTTTPEPSAPEPVVTAGTTAAAVPTDPAEEDALMAKLHELGQRDPEQSIRLAREGNRKFPKGPGASERAWIVCKSLTNLARFDEAREEAQKMVREYPGTSWTMDVIKHILIQPGTHPSQRGYGKQLEGE